MSDLISWAEKEIELAIAREKAAATEAEDTGECFWDYGVACYESALKAFKSLCEDGHSGMSIRITKGILDRLIDGNPLTAIEDTPDVWNDISSWDPKNPVKKYQCKRMSSLFKDVYPEGTVKYSDVDRVICEDIHNHNNTYTNGFIRGIIDEMYPITMPYYGDKFRVVCSDCLTDPKNGDFDSMAIHYIKFEDGSSKTVGRYFKENGRDWAEIDSYEYAAREVIADKLMKENN